LWILGEGMPGWRRGDFPRDEPRRTQKWQSVAKWLQGFEVVVCPVFDAANHSPIGCLLVEVLLIWGVLICGVEQRTTYG
jgi:hypothetical protein